MSGKVKTSVSIDGKLWRRLKEKAAEEGVDVSDYLERLIRKDLPEESLGDLMGEDLVGYYESIDFEPLDLGTDSAKIIREMRDERADKLSRQ